MPERAVEDRPVSWRRERREVTIPLSLSSRLPLAERRMGQPWSDPDREAQLIHRGLYAEYNLVYDRGTRFGLETGHNADAVLMSLPPLAKWV